MLKARKDHEDDKITWEEYLEIEDAEEKNANQVLSTRKHHSTTLTRRCKHQQGTQRSLDSVVHRLRAENEAN